MSYMLLIIERPGQRQERTEDEGRSLYDRMLGFAGDLKQREVLIAAQSLKTDASRLQVRDGRRALVDGPFAEAKEMVGGIFLLDCQTKEEALAIARACPAAEWATIEVREVGPCFL